MTALRVWAPAARRVCARLEGRSLALRPAAGGWWALEHPLAADGCDYTLEVDGGGALPDPRASRLPYGAGGPACTLDHASFVWHDAGWQPPALATGVLYELHVGTFSPLGSFDGAIPYLDALVDLGVSHVELMPVHAFPGVRGWGYDAVGLFAPHEAYGGPAGLKRFVDAAHRRGLAVLLDVVYNHLGRGGEQLARFGPYFTDRYRTPWGEAMNLDGRGSDEVRRFLCDNALAWLRDYHVDGLRLDAVHALFDRSAHPFLAQLREEVAGLEASTGRRYCLIAESDANDPRLVTPPGRGGIGLDAQWNEDFHHAVHALLTGERGGYYADFGTFADLAKALRCGFVYDGVFSRWRGHRHGAPVHDLSGQRFVAFLQNHDQVGNRAGGERLASLVSPARQKLAAVWLLTAPFVPLLFQGEEWGSSTPFFYFTDHADEGFARAVREGRRREAAARGGDAADAVDPQSLAAFERSRLDWKERGRAPHAEILDWYTRLLALRRSRPELYDGSLERTHVECDEAQGWLCVTRGDVRVVSSLAPHAQLVPLEDTRDARLLLASVPGVRLRERGVELPRDGVAVLSGGRAAAWCLLPT